MPVTTRTQIRFGPQRPPSVKLYLGDMAIPAIKNLFLDLRDLARAHPDLTGAAVGGVSMAALASLLSPILYALQSEEYKEKVDLLRYYLRTVIPLTMGGTFFGGLGGFLNPELMEKIVGRNRRPGVFRDLNYSLEEALANKMHQLGYTDYPEPKLGPDLGDILRNEIDNIKDVFSR